ncbi:hypothetical protein [Paraglaciecola sp. L1A13]|uniref:hypothetical protein n=1 Tax=Paraglaciecola sp. L1A13 TaxID=2686359 RepID=UPI00131E8829|nr:hypothetical protein [Paraglaciecola sp. L1A13]
MLILIALQSLATVAKTQEFHQVKSEHLALIHQLAPDHQSTSLINVNNDAQIPAAVIRVTPQNSSNVMASNDAIAPSVDDRTGCQLRFCTHGIKRRYRG